MKGEFENRLLAALTGEYYLPEAGFLFSVCLLLELVASYTLGGFIHTLFVVAMVMVLIRLIQGRRGII